MIYTSTPILSLRKGQNIVLPDGTTGDVEGISGLLPGGRVWIYFVDGTRYPIHYTHHAMATDSSVFI